MLSNFFMFCILCGCQEDQLKLMRLPYQNTILSITVPVMAYVTSAVPSIGTGGGGDSYPPRKLDLATCIHLLTYCWPALLLFTSLASSTLQPPVWIDCFQSVCPMHDKAESGLHLDWLDLTCKTVHC